MKKKLFGLFFDWLIDVTMFTSKGFHIKTKYPDQDKREISNYIALNGCLDTGAGFRRAWYCCNETLGKEVLFFAVILDEDEGEPQ